MKRENRYYTVTHRSFKHTQVRVVLSMFDAKYYVILELTLVPVVPGGKLQT